MRTYLSSRPLGSNMPIRKVLEMNGGRTGGVTLPKEELEADGVMTDGELDDDTYACVVKTDSATKPTSKRSVLSFRLLTQVGTTHRYFTP